METSNTKIVGRSVISEGAWAKVTGRAKYTADLEFPRMLHAKVVRPPYAHARIIGISTEEAVKLPGVVAVLTPEDLPTQSGDPTWVQVLVRERVRSYADVVAVVAAETEQIATAAAKMVRVEYDELPAVFDVEEAVKSEAPIIHGKSNLFNTDRIRKGKVDVGFKEADVVIERSYSVPFAEHAYIETETAVGVPEANGKISVFGSFKAPFDVRRMVAKILDVPLDQVRVVPVTLGGYFGGKDEDMALMASRVALLARKTGRPVRISNNREESILESTKRHRYVMRYKIGATKDGRLTAMEIEALVDAGAYSVKTPIVTFRSAVEATGPYVVPHVKVDIHSVFTNNNNAGAFRGFGSPQVNFGAESIMDELAETLNMDPFQLRMTNALYQGAETATGQILKNPVSLKLCLEKAAAKSSWHSLRQKRSSGPIKRGIGMAACFRGISLGAKGFDSAGAIVSIQEDARILVSCGIREGGQGSRTVLSQVCAEALGVPIEQVRFLDWDTDSVPDSGPTTASRGTLVGGNAVKNACAQLLNIICQTAGEVLGVDPTGLICCNSIIKCKADPEKYMTFNQAVAESLKQGRKLIAIGCYKAPQTGSDLDTGLGEPFFDYVYGADVAEVEVDTLTGRVQLINYISVHDVGKAINPELAAGQIYGGVCMGLGTALYEEYELVKGRPKMLNLDQYVIPTAVDMGEVEAVILEGNLKEGPYGASSIGEPALQIVAPAIVNAIFHATGRRIRDLPADLEKVFLGQALEKKAERGSEVRDK